MQRIVHEFQSGEKTACFRIVGYEVVRNPINGEQIYLNKWDYIKFAIKHLFRFKFERDWFYREPNKIIIFF